MLSNFLLIALTCFPVALVVTYCPEGWWWLCLGGAAWVAAVACKVMAIAILGRRAPTRQAPRAIFQGFVSALSELSIAAGVLAVQGDVGTTLTEWLALGVGAAATENALVLVAAFLDQPKPELVEEWNRYAPHSTCVRFMTAIDRAVATGGHVASRGLLGLAMNLQSLALAAFVLATFTATDTIPAYGNAAGWHWCRPEICRRTYLALTAIVVLELTVLATAHVLTN